MAFKYENYTDEQREKVIEEMISQIDFETIKKCAYISVHKGIRIGALKDEIITRYIREWAEAKWKYYVLFGNSFFLEQNVEYKANLDTMLEKYNETTLQFPKYAIQLQSFDKSDIGNNVLNFPPKWCENFCSGVRGKKLTKVISQIFDDDVLDIALSKIYQNTYEKSTVTISCHIMDYLTTSLNKYSWNSCYNIQRGCFSVGPWSLMRDDCTLVAYVASGCLFTYNNGEKFNSESDDYVEIRWNNKHYRSHILFDEQGYTVGRAQGAPSEWFIDTIREMMDEKIYGKSMSIVGTDFDESRWSHIRHDMYRAYSVHQKGVINYVVGSKELVGAVSGETIKDNYSLY